MCSTPAALTAGGCAHDDQGRSALRLIAGLVMWRTQGHDETPESISTSPERSCLARVGARKTGGETTATGSALNLCCCSSIAAFSVSAGRAQSHNGTPELITHLNKPKELCQVMRFAHEAVAIQRVNSSDVFRVL